MAKTSEFDAKRNSILYTCLCITVTIIGTLIALGIAYGVDGKCVTDTFFNGKSAKDCLSTTDSTITNTIEETCPKGYWGKDCLPCLNCYGHGVCYGSGLAKDDKSGDGTCLCNKGFTGIQCNKCLPGYYGNDCKPCDNCNGHGVCIGTASTLTIVGEQQQLGTCKCYYPFKGTNCNQCIPGLFGTNCDLKCDSTTCTNGVCSSSTSSSTATTTNTSICKCNQGYQGTDCNQCIDGYDLLDDNTNNNNNNNKKKCIFNYTNYCIQNQSKTQVNSNNYMNYYGKTCNLCSDTTCNGHGKCNSGINGGGYCTCNDNWFGTACNKNQTNELITRIRCTNANDDMNRCHNNGLCYQSTSNTNDKICICSKGYTGENCTKCDDGYELDSASSSSTTTIKCKSVCALTGMEHCYGHGTCNTMTKTCTCTSNTSLTSGFYTGQYCNTCQENTFGATCDQCPMETNCLNGKCKGSGTNQGDGTCACFTGYEGSKCNACAYGYTLDTSTDTCKHCPVHSITNKICNEPYGKCNIDTTTTSNNNNNNNIAICTCIDGYEGNTCGVKKIIDNPNNKDNTCINNCHNNGQCANGICFCNSEYTGTYCNITAQPKCTENSCATCETCNMNTGFCELIDRCCGRGEYFNDQCFCKRGYSGVDCSTSLTVTEQQIKHYAYKWINGEYVKNTEDNKLCSKFCGNGIKERNIKCVEYTNELDSTTFVEVADSKCTGMTRPHATIECNTFACTTEGDEENDNTDVRVITLRFDMDYTTVMDDADISKTFEKSLIEDFNILTDGITNENNMEIMSLKEGSVEAYVLMYTNDNNKVIEQLEKVVDVDGSGSATTTTTTTTGTTLSRNDIQALKILTKTKHVVKSGKLTPKEANIYVIEDKGSITLRQNNNARITDSSSMKNAEDVENNNDSTVTSGGAAAISIIIVFVFIGLIVGIGGFIRAKKDWIKRMATESTASRPQQKQIKLTAEEVNNPLMLQMSGGKDMVKNLNDKKATALANAVGTVQRAIQLDNEHNWKEAVKYYKKANDQFAIVLENETNASTRFALAKKVNGYLEREQFLTKKIGNSPG